ncbi:Aldo/keto reductase [Dacryopinax primogenitus]|uniref:Aldo/keto reductase n=1 Tax=Dacryopinax primogenitus (strain DJM 731) TaxID=1858805 RepID=M5GBM9_DACPD|nr:Aldo/keto reductase [Dacryopinax primogenitus]EJU03467.1 Aldo/keto reductase [Dacryopinax primogenitus]
MSTIPIRTLNNGVKMPAIGLGCWSGTTPEEQAKSEPWILTALENGYRHLDTAYGYHTEKYVGNAVRRSGIPREEIFITTKLPSNHHARVAESLEESLERAGLDYFDLLTTTQYLMHWPMAFHYRPDGSKRADGKPDLDEETTFSKTWADMEKLVGTGKVRAIGISNFSVQNLDILLKDAKIVPAVNQVELHPLLAQNELVKYCLDRGIMLTAYSPTGYAQVREHPEVIKVASKHNASPAQISLAWHLARGYTACPKSTDSGRQKENLNRPTLDKEDMDILNSIDENVHLCNYGPPPLVSGWTYEQLGWSRPYKEKN